MKRVLCFGVSLTIGGVSKVVLDYYLRINHEKVVFDFETVAGVAPFYENEVLVTGSNILKNCRYREGVFQCLKTQWRHIKNGHYDIIYSHNGYKAAPQMLFAKLLGVKSRIAHSLLLMSRSIFCEGFCGGSTCKLSGGAPRIFLHVAQRPQSET